MPDSTTVETPVTPAQRRAAAILANREVLTPHPTTPEDLAAMKAEAMKNPRYAAYHAEWEGAITKKG